MFILVLKFLNGKMENQKSSENVEGVCKYVIFYFFVNYIRKFFEIFLYVNKSR